jgi:hypothetical protein
MYFMIRRMEVSETAELVCASRDEIRSMMDSA